MASSSISSSSSPPVPLASHPHLRTTATTTTAAAPPSHPVSASEPIEALLRKEGTSRKLILMAEAMARRQVHNGWVSALPPLHSSDGFTPFGGFCSNGSAGDAGEGGDTRPSTRNGGARPPTGGRPLTGSLQNFGTPLNSPREKSRGSPNHSHHRLAPGASSSWSNSHSLDGWVADNAQTLSLLNAQKYTKAYVCVSAVLSQYSSDSVKSVILRCRRGMCSFALMNYKECLDDFQVAYHLLTELRRNQNKNNPNSSSPSDSLIPTADFNESEMMRTWIKAFIMREDYRAAETMYTRVLENRKALGISTVECRAMEQEMRALLDVERFRNSVSQENWTQALTYMTGAKCVLEDTPLRTVQAVAYLETGQADLARETLLPYLPIIPLPLKAEAATEAPPEERQLRCNVEAHYLLTTILLAKASIYSGRQYMNIAASLTQRCLQVHPCYAPAIRIGNYLLALEEFIHKIDQYHSKRLLDAMVDTITEALRLDSANTRICAMLLARRGEARLEQGRYTMAVEDCGRSLQLDGSNAKTYLTRAKAYDGLQRDLEAAADRAMAVQLNPAYESIINEEMERKAQEIRMQRQKEAAAARERQQQQQQPKRAAPRFQQQSAPPKPKASPLPTPPPGSHKRAAVARNATLYDTLSVSMQATTEQIRQAFKKLTLQCHPDKMVNESEAQQLRALEMFKAINHAHSVLSDPARRAEYDLTILIGPQR